jgi:hypothetical protein
MVKPQPQQLTIDEYFAGTTVIAVILGGFCGGILSGYNIIEKTQTRSRFEIQDLSVGEFIGQGLFGVLDGMILGGAWPLTFPVVIGMVCGKLSFAVGNVFRSVFTMAVPPSPKIQPKPGVNRGFGQAHLASVGVDGRGKSGLSGLEQPCTTTSSSSTQTECCDEEEEEYVV